MKKTRLKQARKAAGLSRNKVARAMHKSPHTVKAWETTDRQPRTMREIKKLCSLLNIRVEWYLAGEGSMHPIESGAKEQELLTLFSGLTEEQQDAVLGMMRVM
ncbi:helix-turn-helix transcriptional regulator [Photobacterium sp. OFAV2-7]|uniref:helix-turn-helix transcriptional regulator n=1 Tax=Photobacterium sp. OFAV2-7 TaxID=2917748 RepID=UPI001EF5319A|nr:helix-turn-helix transcriptional regulator [Photobacterium sp. OFAV2-7]MCG7588363.1 helix-turn-helix transcriptional regulator [Photobacterium sp. OFAV2-7]